MCAGHFACVTSFNYECSLRQVWFSSPSHRWEGEPRPTITWCGAGIIAVVEQIAGLETSNPGKALSLPRPQVCVCKTAGMTLLLYLCATLW